MALDCYVEDGFWALDYTVCDDCVSDAAISRRGGGVSAEYAKQADLAKAAFDKRELEWDRDLSRIVESVFSRELKKSDITAPQEAKPTKNLKKRATLSIYDVAKTQNLAFELSEIRKLVDAYADLQHSLWLDIIRRRDEDALILLLLGA